MSRARAGTCRVCGRDLVQTDDRTYHPAVSLPDGELCPVLLPIPGTTYRSYDVAPVHFVPS